MAQPTNDEELQLRKRARRRLIGAVVLVMVVVLVLPMVLDTEPKPVSQDIDIRIPSPDTGAFKAKIVPIAPAPDAKPPEKGRVAPPTSQDGAKDAAAIKQVPVASDSPAARGDTAPKSEGATVRKPDVAPKPVAEPAGEDAKSALGAATMAHVVQVAALLNAERAGEIQDQIRAAGIKSYTEIVKTARGDVTRVRAGPFATREEAEAMRRRLKELGLDGKVTTR